MFSRAADGRVVTSKWMSHPVYLAFRAVWALIFVGHFAWHCYDLAVVADLGIYYLLPLTTHALIVETFDMVLQLCACLCESQALLSACVVVNAIAQPLSLIVALLFWVLLVGNSDEDVVYIDYFAHGINCGLLLVSLLVGRMPYSCSYAGWVVLFAVGWMAWSYLHYTLRIGTRYGCQGYERQDCPLYGVLDWHYPKETGELCLVAGLVVPLLVSAVYCGIVWARDACDKEEERPKEPEMELLLLEEEPAKPAKPVPCCLRCA